MLCDRLRHMENSAAPKEVYGLQIERVMAEAEAARQEAHAQKALSRTLQEQQRLLDEEVLQQETTIKSLTNELADKEVQLQNAQRKLFQARTSRCGSFPVHCICDPLLPKGRWCRTREVRLQKAQPRLLQEPPAGVFP